MEPTVAGRLNECQGDRSAGYCVHTEVVPVEVLVLPRMRRVRPVARVRFTLE